MASNVLRRFKFEVTPWTKKTIPAFQVVLKPVDGLNVVLSPRSY